MTENENLPVDTGHTKLPWRKQPGFFIASGLIILAFVLLALWACNPDLGPESKPTTTPTVTLPVNTPIVSHFEPTQPKFNEMTPTIEPTVVATPEPRKEVITYTMVEGDTLYSVADKFNLSPETIYWGNYNLNGMGSDPKEFVPGRSIYILPTDGVYYK